jgi:FkbM family methyltransferase
VLSEQFRRKIRENIFTEVTSKWPQSMAEKLFTGVDDDRVYPIWYKTLMSGEFDHLLEFTNPNKASIDIGALLGQYSLTLSSLATKCLCIEPLINYSFLKMVLPPNCRFITMAVGDQSGEGILNTPDYQYGLSSLLSNDWQKTAKIVTQQATRIMTLDEIVEIELPNESIGFIKIDVEGYELEVLAGAMKVLSGHRPNLQIEIERKNLKKADEMLKNLDYTGLFFFDGRIHEIGQFDPDIHQNPEYAWLPGVSQGVDKDLFVVNFFFVPNR